MLPGGLAGRRFDPHPVRTGSTTHGGGGLSSRRLSMRSPRSVEAMTPLAGDGLGSAFSMRRPAGPFTGGLLVRSGGSNAPLRSGQSVRAVPFGSGAPSPDRHAGSQAGSWAARASARIRSSLKRW